jgi:hypothetical protein
VLLRIAASPALCVYTGRASGPSDAIAEAVSYMFENPNPSQLTPAQIDKEIDLTKQVLSKHLCYGYLMQNLAEEFGQFRPGPSPEALNHMLNPPQ